MILIRSNYCCWSIIYIYRNHCVSFCWCYFSLWINLRKKKFFFSLFKKEIYHFKMHVLQTFLFSLTFYLSLFTSNHKYLSTSMCMFNFRRSNNNFFLIIEFLFIHQSIFIIYELRRISSMFVIYKWLKRYGVCVFFLFENQIQILRKKQIK